MTDKTKKEKPSKDPFSNRKGSSVSDGDSTEEGLSGEASAAGDIDFQREMIRQGVRPREGGRDIPGKDDPDGEKDLFLSAMAKLEEAGGAGETEDARLEDPHHRAKARRSRRLARGEIHPADHLDLHGLTRDDALLKVRYFLEHAVFQGDEAVLIITGKGTGSASGPVLRRAVQQALERGLKNLVLEWCQAPARLGGSGALVVFLRPRA